jgi:NAD(P)-dependent dehydrogenase (short-subunit alcohol dehydrogenase family)
VLSQGTGAGGPLTAVTQADWERTMAVNLTGTFLGIKHAGASMVAAGGGAIVALSSIAGPLTHRYMTPYAVSKAAIEALIRGAADELGAFGVRVNAVRPGLVPTDLANPLSGNDGIVADYIEQMPLGRLGTPEDVAAGIRYLCGPESAWVTGQCFAIDGGHTLRRGPDITRAT